MSTQPARLVSKFGTATIRRSTRKGYRGWRLRIYPARTLTVRQGAAPVMCSSGFHPGSDLQFHTKDRQKAEVGAIAYNIGGPRAFESFWFRNSR